MELMTFSGEKHTREILKSISRKVSEFALQEIMICPTKHSGIINLYYKKPIFFIVFALIS